MCQILQSVKNFYNKVCQILQGVTIITKCSTTHGAFKHLFHGGDQVTVQKNVQIRSFFWSVFSRIWTEYRDLLSKSQYSVKIQENTDQRKLFIWTLFMQ